MATAITPTLSVASSLTDCGTATGANQAALAGLGNRLSKAAMNAKSDADAAQAVLQALLLKRHVIAAFRLVLLEDQWSLAERAVADDGALDGLPAILAAAQVAHAQDRAVQFTVRAAAGPSVVAIAPIAANGTLPGAVGVVWQQFPPGPDVRLLVAQLAAANLTHACQSRSDQQPQASALQAAAIVELVLQTQQKGTLDGASAQLVQSLQSFLPAHRVALGWSPRPGKPCRLRAVSGLRQLDRQAELCRAYEAALEESRLREGCLVWTVGATAPLGMKALARLASLTGSRTIVGLALVAGSQTRGALLVLHPESSDSGAEQQRFLTAAAPVLAGGLDQVHRAEPGRFRQACRACVPRKRGWRNALVGAVITAAVTLALPWPHKISVPCRLEPVARRFLAAPFDGILERSCVLPGDQVAEHQMLALLDGHELRSELSGLDAEYRRAEKERDVAMVRHESAAAQQARLELQRIDLKRELLARRMANLEIRSPIAGIVVSGDLSKAQHAPVEAGQKLFEVAPLDAMVAELAVSEADVAHVQPGQKVRLAIDAWPSDVWTGNIALVRPRAETRDGNSVFIVEVHLENATGHLRPGMNGQAKIVAPSRSIGWLMFHKPYEALARLLGW